MHSFKMTSPFFKMRLLKIGFKMYRISGKLLKNSKVKLDIRNCWKFTS